MLKLEEMIEIAGKGTFLVRWDECGQFGFLVLT